MCVFQALMVWDVNSSRAALSKSLPHSHRDWITGCVWTPDCVVRVSRAVSHLSYRSQFIIMHHNLRLLLPDQLLKRWQALFMGSAGRPASQRDLLEELSHLRLLSGEMITDVYQRN